LAYEFGPPAFHENGFDLHVCRSAAAIDDARHSIEEAMTDALILTAMSK
jgi:hypothetical protein